MIFIDAFSSKYLDKDFAPFLYALQQEGHVKHVTSLPAFMGIGTTIFSGTWPATNGAWTNFIKKNHEDISFSLIQYLFSFFSLIPNDRLSWDLRYLTYRILKKPVPIPNQIPSHLVNFFKSKVEAPLYSDDFLNDIPTLFTTLNNFKKSFTIINQFMDSDEKVAKRTIEYLKLGNCSDLVYLKFSSLDIFGHEFGPSSNPNHNRVRIIDNLINEIINEADKSSEDFKFIIFSDHGMSPILKYFDIQAHLKDISEQVIKDYLIFIDSTMARFWFNNNEARKEITNLLTEKKDGYILSDLYLQENNLPINKKEYGELIFALKEGIVMQPDFFHKNSIMKGMHGHFDSIYDKPILIIYPSKFNDNNKNNVRFIDIMPTTLKLLDIPIPKTCEGKSLI